MNALADILTGEFSDKETAHVYMQAHLVEKIASQVYTLRKQRKLTQEGLAKLSGVPQGKISIIESADFESLSLSTLFKLAEAFDVALDVRMQSFSKAIKGVVSVNKEALQVPSRHDDLYAQQNVAKLISNPAFDKNLLNAKFASNTSAKVQTGLSTGLAAGRGPIFTT